MHSKVPDLRRGFREHFFKRDSLGFPIYLPFTSLPKLSWGQHYLIVLLKLDKVLAGLSSASLTIIFSP